MAAAGCAGAQAAEDRCEDETHEEEDPPTGGVVVLVVAVRVVVVVVDLHRRGLLNDESLWLLGLLVLRCWHCHRHRHHGLRHGHRHCHHGLAHHRLPIRHGLLLLARHGLSVGDGDGRLHESWLVSRRLWLAARAL